MEVNIGISEIEEPVNLDGVRADFINEKYGNHERNTFDMWLAKSATPTPLVIYIHGGGFISGDKSRYYKSEDLMRFLKSGVSVASINYRFMTEEPYGILTCLNDAKRCLQYIRWNYARYNIDKNRIACSGGSAGAGTALWLAFSDNMADPESEDPVMRESTRILCAGAFATQATYDIFKWRQIIGVPVAETPEQLRNIALAFGVHYVNGIDLSKHEKIRKELDFLNKMDKNDPPVFIYNKHKGGIPATEDDLNHHPLHARAIKDKAEEVGLEAVVYAPEIGIVDKSGKDLVEFFLDKLI
ncbi:MAG: alpha/beta hydrolase [Prolixibacteraceae bacterium]|nr:alpha/beta hydrolase [Prolixibacteraceae bacterium]